MDKRLGLPMKGKTMSIYVQGLLDGEPHIYVPTEGLYSDNTVYVKGLPDRNMQIDEVAIKTTTIQGLVAGVDYVDFLRMQYGAKPDLFIPYLPGARQDRRNLNGDVLLTSRRAVDIIESAKDSFGNVFVVDVHNPDVLPTHWFNITAANVIKNGIIQGQMPKDDIYYDAVIAPDHGARLRASNVADIFHVPLVVASKVRDTSDGKIVSYKIDTSQTEMRRVLVVDDLCDGGFTFELLSHNLPAYTKRDLYVTHGLFSKGTHRLRENYDNIITTDSVYAERGMGINVINLLPGVN